MNTGVFKKTNVFGVVFTKATQVYLSINNEFCCSKIRSG